jgi:3'-phosphoadenosine 5'-phosphosulfate sulfotransferase (PAPS reductase)/FAD synthetase
LHTNSKRLTLNKIAQTSNAKKGGLFTGKSHAEGGIPAIVTDTGQPIEVEGGEAIITKKATAMFCNELSEINQAGGGVPIPCPDDVEKIMDKFDKGGLITQKEKKQVHDKWKSLVNMTYTELKTYYNSKDGKSSGLTKSEANEQGISSGRESAEWILKMKRQNWKEWSSEMWKWAKKQISFVSRMRGVEGAYFDENNKRTPKLKALLIWGHNPAKFLSGGQIAPKTDNNKVRDWKVRFHLGQGVNFMKWKVENAKTKETKFEDPDKVQIEMFNCKLTNSPKTAMKIFTGEIDKSPIAWVVCEKVKINKDIDPVDPTERLSYNPRKAPNWVDTDGNIVDNYVFEKLITFGRGVYYETPDGELFEVGGYVEQMAKGKKIEENKDQYQLLFDEFEDYSNEPMEIDNTIQELTNTYEQDIDVILGVDEVAERRSELLSWIKNPAKDVKVIIAFSGGKDSVAMVLRAIYDFKIPKSQIELWHHEVDGMGENLFDWKCTPSYCQAFADAMGVPLLFSYSYGGILKEMYRENDYRQPMFFQKVAGGEFIKTEPIKKPEYIKTKRKFPAVANDLKTRWCSSVAKIEVMSKAINNNEKFDIANIVIMTGERRSESKNRAKYHEIEKYRNSNKNRQAITWRCVIDMTEAEIWDLYKKHKIQPHPCYELGWGRCSCQLCIFGQKDTWASINELSPEKVKRVADIEKDLGHSLYNEHEKLPFNPPKYNKTGKSIGQERFQKGKKLDNIYEAKVTRGKSFIPKDALQRWSKEALGEFVSPIFVDEWKLPYGAFNNEQSGAN